MTLFDAIFFTELSVKTECGANLGLNSVISLYLADISESKHFLSVKPGIFTSYPCPRIAASKYGLDQYFQYPFLRVKHMLCILSGLNCEKMKMHAQNIAKVLQCLF